MGRLASDRVHDHLERTAVDLSAQPLGGIDRRMGPQAAGMELDPVALDRRRRARMGQRLDRRRLAVRAGRPGGAEDGGEPDRAVERTRVDAGSSAGQNRTLHAGGSPPARPGWPCRRSQTPRASRPPARAPPRRPSRAVRRSARTAVRSPPRRRSARTPPRGASHRHRATGDWRRRLQPSPHSPRRRRRALRSQRQPEVRGEHECRRRGGRADVGDAVGQRVVEVEHMTGGGDERDIRQEVGTARSDRARRAFPRSGARARQPVGERHAVGGGRHPHRVDLDE